MAAADTEEPSRNASISFRSALSVLFFLSGAVGLLYEIVWFRKLHLIFGVSIFAIGAVVTAFMLGLACGSRWAGSSRWLRRRPLEAYAFFEAAIAVYALAFPALVAGLEAVYVALFGFLEGRFVLQSVIRFILGFAVLLPPTFLMGATLPALAEAAARGSQKMARRVGILYMINTLGGVAGTLAAGFYALEHFGIAGSLRIGIAGNLVVAAGAFLLILHPAYRQMKRFAEEGPAAPPAAAGAAPVAAASAAAPMLGFAAATLAITGLVSMAGEIVWTRALVFFIHNSTYAFSGILAVYLLGIALGAAFGARVAARAAAALRWLCGMLVAVSVCLLVSIAIYRNLPAIVEAVLSPAGGEPASAVGGWTEALGLIVVQTAVVLFAPAFLFGMAFPLAMGLVQERRASTAGVVGKLYAANTAGCVAGTILGTFALVPLLGTRSALLLIAWLPVPAAIWAAAKCLRRRWLGAKVAGVFAGVFAAAMIGGSFLAAPAGFYRGLFEKRFGEVIWFSEGVSETVAVCVHPDGKKWIHYSDGRGASGSISFVGGWLYAHLPLLLHPEPRSALIICLGTGNTLGAASRHGLEVLDGVELSSEVVEAFSVFKETNHDVGDNPAVNVIIQDGRNYLLATPNRYDVISEEPPLVHTAGVVNLYSEDFYRLCVDRMTDDGIMAVWLATWEIEEADLRMLIKAFVEAFPHATLWDCMHTREWLLLGSKQPLRIDLDRLERRMSRPPVAADLERIGITSPADLLALYLRGRDWLAAFAGDASPVTDDRTVVDFRTPRSERANFGLGERTTSGLVLGAARAQGTVSAARLRDFDSVYTLRESAEALIADYGSRERDAFRDELERKRRNRAFAESARIVLDVMAVARDLRAGGDLPASLAMLRRGAELVPPPASEPLLMTAAALCRTIGFHREAEDFVGRARRLDPGLKEQAYEMMRRSGEGAHRNRDHGYAAEVFGFLAMSPRGTWLDWARYGKALAMLGRPAEARDALLKSLERRQNNPEARFWLGRVALLASDPVAAVEQFEAACRLQPDDAAAWYYNVYAAWLSRGEEAALGVLSRARALGVSLGEQLRGNLAAWDAAGAPLRAALEAELRAEQSASR